jgi:hypothetical protein
MYSGYIKICCSCCEKDTRAKEKHYKIKDWPMRENSVPGESISEIDWYFAKIRCFLWPLHINPLNAELNSICHLLVLLGAHPILHISRIKVKLVFMKSFAKAMNKRAKCFEYLRENFPKFSNTKLKESIWFHGSLHHSKNHLEITNKMRPCVRIYYSNFY